VNAIKENLTSKGLKYVESNGDLTINAITILKDKQSVTSSTNYYGYGGLYRPYGYYGGMRNTSVTTYNYKDGSLTIEMVDTKTTKMVWQGIGNKEIDKVSKDPDSEIKAAVTKILADFPPNK
jgi:hypothetical protein